MTAPNRRGRRQPALVPTESEPEVQELSQVPDELEQQQDDSGDFQLLYPGATVEASITLAVDFGDGKTNFIKYAATDIVQEGEDHPQAYSRMATVTIEGVVSLIDDTQDRLAEYEQEVLARRAAMERQTSGR